MRPTGRSMTVGDESDLRLPDFEVSLAALSKWTGPQLFVKIHADSVSVVSSTDVLGKAEFVESLFREKLDAHTTKSYALRREETKCSDCSMVEMRFDRDGDTLRLVINAMRGYPIEDEFHLLNALQRRMFLADCEYYKLPSILARFKAKALPISGINWDLTRINSSSHTIVESERVLVRNAPSGWMCSGLNVLAKSGDTKWVEFLIQKTEDGSLMFGVVESQQFTTAGYFTAPVKGVGYYAYNGRLYRASTNVPFAEKSTAGDKIRIRVCMDVSGENGTFTVFKNGAEIGTEELSKHMALDKGVLFAVCTYNVGVEVKITDAGID